MEKALRNRGDIGFLYKLLYKGPRKLFPWLPHRGNSLLVLLLVEFFFDKALIGTPMDENIKIAYLKEVLGISSVIAPQGLQLDVKKGALFPKSPHPENPSLKGALEEENEEFIWNYINLSKNSVLFLFLEPNENNLSLNDPEYDLLNKIISAIKIDPKDTAIASISLSEEFEKRITQSRDLGTLPFRSLIKENILEEAQIKKYSHIFLMGKKISHVLFDLNENWVNFESNEKGIKIMTTYHPRELLEDSSLKALAWNGLKKFAGKI